MVSHPAPSTVNSSKGEEFSKVKMVGIKVSVRLKDFKVITE